MKLLQLLLNALFFLGLYAWKSTNIIHPLNKFRTLRSFAINNDNSETDVSPKSALAKRILIKKKIVTNASSQTKPSNIFGRKETNKKHVFDLLDESTIKFAKEGRYQDSNFVNLDRLIKDDKKTVDNKFSSQGNQQRGKIQGDYEVQQYLEEISEEFEDLTTPENIQYFQPETESNIPLSPLPNVEPQLNTKPVDSSSNPFKSGFVSIIGNPNVGKSTLMNFLLKQKLSIVSAKPQTTRHKIYGILTEENQYQIVFMDTPGMLYQNKAAYTLHETMQSVIRYAAMDTDVLLLITDIFSDELQDEKIMEKLKRAPYPVVIVVNKIDLLPEISLKLRRQPKQLKKLFSFNETLPKLIHPDIPLTRAKINETVTLDSVKEKWKALLPQAEIIPVSAAYNLGVTELLEKIVSYLKPGPKYYPSDYVSDRDERFFTSEIIRESIFESFDGEIPYCCEVYIEDFKDVRDDFSKITATIYVNRKSQVNIVVGREGCKIKEVGMKSRQKLENFLERKVHLDLQVKNDPDWRSKKDSLKKFGYIEDE